jgi:phage tail P2-like protein
MPYITDLKKYLPEAQRNSVPLNEFLDAVGELLDGFKTAIDDVQKYNDFQLIEEKHLDNLAKQFNVDFPRNMSVTRKREYIREIISLYRAKGTTKSVQRIFRLIGWDVDIDEYWIVNPVWYQNPTDKYTLTNEQGSSYQIGLYETIVGNTKIYKTDKIYIDIIDKAGNVYPKKQIYGEPYKVDEEINFVKVPYIRINVKSEDFDLFTSDYVENGNLYSYDTSEEFEILSSIKTYLLDKIRPATVAIVEISTPFSLSDTITYTITENSGSANLTGAPSLTFDENFPQTITRGAGSWITDGFLNESTINISNSTNYNGTYKIKSVGTTVLTLYKETLLEQQPNLVLNGDISSGTTGWSGNNAILSSYGNTLHITNSVGSVESRASQQISTVSTQTYRVIGSLSSTTSTGNAYINVGTTLGASDVLQIPISAIGVYTNTFISPQATLYISLASSTSQLINEDFGWDDISVRLDYPLSSIEAVAHVITDDYHNINSSNAGAKYDGSITYGIATDRYILGETMGGFQYGNSNMDYYGVNEDAPTETISRTYTNSGTNTTQPLISCRKFSEVHFTIDHASEIVSVYGVKNDRASVVNGDPLDTTALLTNISGTGKYTAQVEGYYYIMVITTFDAGQQIEFTYTFF